MGQKGGSSPWQIDVLKFGGGVENFHMNMVRMEMVLVKMVTGGGEMMDG